MCRSIKTLYNFDPSATDDEIRAAALQFVRKLSGYHEPSKANEAAFYQAVDQTASVVERLFVGLVTQAAPHNREVEADKAHSRNLKRYGKHETHN